MQFIIVAPSVNRDDVAGKIAISVLVDVVEEAPPPVERNTLGGSQIIGVEPLRMLPREVDEGVHAATVA